MDQNKLRGDYINIEKLLNGEYEVKNLDQSNVLNEHVPDFGYSIINQIQSLYTPIADLDHLESGGEKPVWPENKDFAVCLTHDMDSVSAHDFRQSLRKSWSRANARLNGGTRSFEPNGVVPAIKSLIGGVLRASKDVGKSEDPYHCYEKWLDLEESHGGKSTFFVPPTITDDPHISDPSYRFDDEVVFDGNRSTVAEMVQEIDSRGWEIGLHPTWYAATDSDLLRRQKEQIESILGHEITSVRQHYLHYDMRKTPAVHDEVGFKFDSTLGFNNNLGFRFGSSYPWRLYDHQSKKRLDLLEVPLVVQDTAIFRRKGLHIDEDMGMEYITQLAEEVKQTGGVLTLLWHPASISRPSYWSLYKRTLEKLNEMNAWFASVSEIGNWWKQEGPQRSRYR